MENWKKGLLIGSAGASVLLLLKGKKAAGMVLGGITVATLAAEYPEKFRQIRESLPDYLDRGNYFLELTSRIGERLASAAKNVSEELSG